MPTLYDIPVTTIDGRTTTLAEYRGKVLLIVNVAGKCGFTGQYEGLEKLYKEHAERGLVVLGFPCNQFLSQEPGTDAEIQAFCTTKFNVTFPMFAKIDVNGPNAHPLYRYLKSARPGLLGFTAIKWNFTKFLVNRAGDVVARYSAATTPAGMGKAIGKLLDAKPATVGSTSA